MPSDAGLGKILFGFGCTDQQYVDMQDLLAAWCTGAFALLPLMTKQGSVNQRSIS